MLRKDNLPFGIVLGVFTPVLAFFLYFLFFVMMAKHIGLNEFLSYVSNNRQLLPKLISICLLLNGVVFYVYTSVVKNYVTAKGIFLVTMIYAMVILLLKILHG
jgi:hypothetical protein